MDIGTIVSGVTADNVPYLKLFLIDYKKEFNVEKVNPSCSRCLNGYLNDFKKKYNKMENNSNYRLHKKRENLILKFGSPIRVNNSNITDDYAEQLIKNYSKNPNFSMDFLFDKYPTTKVKEVAPTLEVQTEQTAKKTRKKRK